MTSNLRVFLSFITIYMAEQQFSWPLIGNRQITEFLERSILNDSLGGTYIFYGPDNLGKTTLAVHFARILFCQAKDRKILPCGQCPACLSFVANHKAEGNKDSEQWAQSDFFLIKKEKDKKNITVEKVRDFIRSLAMTSFLNSYKIGIIKHAETLSAEAANALLKTLEEPKRKVIIILITHSLDALPTTIASRAQILRFHPVSTDVIYDYLIKDCGASRSQAKNFARLSLGRPALAVKFCQDKEFYQVYQERARVFLDFFNQNINERLTAVEKIIGRQSGQAAVTSARRILQIWLGVLRDRLLLQFGHQDRIQHHIFESELENQASVPTAEFLLSDVKLLRQAEKYLDANVNPRLVLENIAINL